MRVASVRILKKKSRYARSLLAVFRITNDRYIAKYVMVRLRNLVLNPVRKNFAQIMVLAPKS